MEISALRGQGRAPIIPDNNRMTHITRTLGSPSSGAVKNFLFPVVAKWGLRNAAGHCGNQIITLSQITRCATLPLVGLAAFHRKAISNTLNLSQKTVNGMIAALTLLSIYAHYCQSDEIDDLSPNAGFYITSFTVSVLYDIFQSSTNTPQAIKNNMASMLTYLLAKSAGSGFVTAGSLAYMAGNYQVISGYAPTALALTTGEMDVVSLLTHHLSLIPDNSNSYIQNAILDVLPTLLRIELRTLLQYQNLMRNAPEVIAAQENFKQACINKARYGTESTQLVYIAAKTRFLKAIQDEMSAYPRSFNQRIGSFLVEKLGTPFILPHLDQFSLRNIENNFLSFGITDDATSAAVEEIIKIHLQHVLYLSPINQSNRSNLTIPEQLQLIRALFALSVSHYSSLTRQPTNTVTPVPQITEITDETPLVDPPLPQPTLFRNISNRTWSVIRRGLEVITQVACAIMRPIASLREKIARVRLPNPVTANSTLRADATPDAEEPVEEFFDSEDNIERLRSAIAVEDPLAVPEEEFFDARD